MKRLQIDRERCTGCESCVLACSFEHGDRFGLHLSRIRVARNEEQASFRPTACIQCDAHPCIESCPVGALSINSKTGAIQVAEETCTGCRTCATVCPFDGIHFSEGIVTPFICDLCGGDPECVRVCRLPQAITYAEPK